MSDGTIIPPQNIEAEESVIGAALVAEPALQRVSGLGLAPGHFYLDRHRQIWTAIEELIRSGSCVDELTVSAKLPSEFRHHVSELAAKVPAAANAAHYARIVLDAATMRQKLGGGQNIIQGVAMAWGGGDADRERGEGLIHQGQAEVATDLILEAQPTSRRELAEFYRAELRRDDDETMATPWEELNECLLGGFRRKQFGVFAGHTGMGKTWAVDQITGGIFGQGYRTAIFGTEMSKEERLARFVTTQTEIPYEKMIRKQLNSQELAQADAALDDLPFDYFESAGRELEWICERIIFGGFDFVVIDVLNLIAGYEEETAKASAIIVRLCELAQQANCCILGVSHLNRERDKGPVKPRPVKRDLRATGIIETNAHWILMLHRDQTDEGRKEPGGEIYTEKVRNGNDGILRVVHHSTKLTFSPEARYDPYEVPAEYVGDGPRW